MANPEACLELPEFLPFRLSVLANRISRSLAAVYRDRFDLRIPEWRVMAVLGQYPDISAEEVARHTCMDKVKVSRAVAGLMAHGRVLRQPDPQDRRRGRLRLSAAGRRVHAQIVPLALGFQAEILADLPAAERRSLEAALATLQARVERVDPRRSDP
ncbi:MAG: MarR family winged helix-turn-helix transcriptional regulator [Gammaproteobacteria bacterium]|nr:MarR family winged helix-turn-helix transcriptional regulator [Gammaproteobacteria bacterium]